MAVDFGLGPILLATVSVENAAAAADLYAASFGFEIIQSGILTDEQTASWATPGLTGANFTIVAPPGRAPGWIRFIESPGAGAYRPLGSSGWAAIEILVQDTDAVARSLEGSLFEVIGEPKSLTNFPEIRAMQVIGPMGEVLYLTTLPESVGDFRLPTAVDAIDRVFIVILATRNFKGVTEGFAADFSIPIGNIRKRGVYFEGETYGHEPAEDMSMTTLQMNRHSLIQVDEYPNAVPDRPEVAGALPSGFAVATFAVPSIEPFIARALGPVVRLDDEPYTGRRALMIRNLEGWLTELVETG
jgi:catechol 2,3-dioxygenase-like lactoylglutathione lyase family enzyme